MSNKAKTMLLEYGICAAVVAVFATVYLSANVTGSTTLLDWYRLLSDAFGVPGLLLAGFGVLCWLAGEGAMDGVMYGLHTLGAYLIPGRRLEKRKTYADFVAERREKKRFSFGFLLISGAVCVAISLVFMLLFDSIHTV